MKRLVWILCFLALPVAVQAAQWEAEILTPWVLTPQGHEAKVAVEYSCQTFDTTNQAAGSIIPDPNLHIRYIVCDADTLAQIEADADYFVLWKAEKAEGVLR